MIRTVASIRSHRYQVWSYCSSSPFSSPFTVNRPGSFSHFQYSLVSWARRLTSSKVFSSITTLAVFCHRLGALPKWDSGSFPRSNHYSVFLSTVSTTDTCWNRFTSEIFIIRFFLVFLASSLKNLISLACIFLISAFMFLCQGEVSCSIHQCGCLLYTSRCV